MNLKEINGMRRGCGLNTFGGYGPLADYCEKDIQPLVFIRGDEFLEQLFHYRGLSTRNTAQCS
jgi:hypothetical protein